ncbi:hypothetical protein HYZ64_02955 [Candidatus Berkelbacteria bacterium]|nr:hypothetical protein [Candidatus Berkelbacteria bacterium]
MDINDFWTAVFCVVILLIGAATIFLIAAIGLRGRHPSEFELVDYAHFVESGNKRLLAPESDAEAIQEHLISCAICRSFVDREQKTWRICQALPPPPGLSPKAQERLSRTIQKEIERQNR